MVKEMKVIPPQTKFFKYVKKGPQNQKKIIGIVYCEIDMEGITPAVYFTHSYCHKNDKFDKDTALSLCKERIDKYQGNNELDTIASSSNLRKYMVDMLAYFKTHKAFTGIVQPSLDNVHCTNKNVDNKVFRKIRKELKTRITIVNYNRYVKDLHDAYTQLMEEQKEINSAQ